MLGRQKGTLGPPGFLDTNMLVYVTHNHQMRHKSHVKVLSKGLNKEK